MSAAIPPEHLALQRLRIVQQLGQGPCIDFTRLATARAAVQGGGLREGTGGEGGGDQAQARRHVRPHHRVHEADARREPGRAEVGERVEDARGRLQGWRK